MSWLLVFINSVLPTAKAVSSDVLAEAAVYPSSVLIEMTSYDDQDNPSSSFCGATFISENILITAAHCANHKKKEKDYITVTESWKDDQYRIADQVAVITDSANIRIHPDAYFVKTRPDALECAYTDSSSGETKCLDSSYDLALIKVNVPVSNFAEIRIIPPVTGEEVTFLGFGVQNQWPWGIQNLVNNKSAQRYIGYNKVAQVKESFFTVIGRANVTNIFGLPFRTKKKNVVSCAGDSGSSVRDADGKIIGVASSASNIYTKHLVKMEEANITRVDSDKNYSFIQRALVELK